MRVKCLAQEHNALSRPGLELRPLDAESSALTIRPLRNKKKIEMTDSESYYEPFGISVQFMNIC